MIVGVFIEIFQKMKKFQKLNYSVNGNKIFQMQIEKEKKKEYMKTYSQKRKSLLNYLIYCVKELENV